MKSVRPPERGQGDRVEGDPLEPPRDLPLLLRLHRREGRGHAGGGPRQCHGNGKIGPVRPAGPGRSRRGHLASRAGHLGHSRRAENVEIVHAERKMKRDPLSWENQAFFHARFGIGRDPLEPYRETIEECMYPDVFSRKPVRTAKAKKAVSDYRKAPGGTPVTRPLCSGERVTSGASVRLPGQACPHRPGPPAPVPPCSWPAERTPTKTS